MFNKQFMHLYIIWGVFNLVLGWQAVLERAEVIKQDPETVDCKISVFKLNRTAFAANATIQLYKDIFKKLTLQLKLYGMYSNEFRELPFLVKRRCCDIFDFEYKIIKDDIHGNFPSKCPVKEGIYNFYNFIPNTKYVPRNPWQVSKFKLELTFVEGTKIYAQIEIVFGSSKVDEYYKG